MSVAGDKYRADRGSIGETIKIVLIALFLAVFVRTFLFQPFNIPSGSMKSTLLVGDYLFVSKYSYGFSRYSLPFAPDWFQGRILGRQPERGDVVVFKLPRAPDIDYIKRVVGLPGDKIQMINGGLQINGKAVPKVRIDDYVTKDDFGTETRVPRFRETLPNGVSYDVLDLDPHSFSDDTPVYDVPPGNYFMMGDNRDNSTDSRVLGAVGYVPFENLVGKADRIFFSVREGEPAWQFWKWPWSVRFDRIFKGI